MSDRLMDERASAHDDDCVGVSEAARRLGISRGGAYRLLAEDRFPVRAFKVGGAWRIPVAAIDALKAER